MAIIGDLPPYIRSKVFDIDHAQQLSPSGEYGFIQTLNRTTPYWMAEFETAPLNAARENEFQSFIDQLEGAINSFRAYDPKRPMPRDYMHMAIGSNPLGTTLNVLLYDYASSFIDLQNGPASGLGFEPGDYLSMQVSGVWYLFRVYRADFDFSGSGSQRVFIKPRIPVTIPPGTLVRYQRACIEMKMIGKAEKSDTVDGLPVFRFKAGQYTARVPT